MMKRGIILIMALLLGFGSLSGCYQTGRVTGEAAEEIEEGAESFGEGYEEGKEDD